MLRENTQLILHFLSLPPNQREQENIDPIIERIQKNSYFQSLLSEIKEFEYEALKEIAMKVKLQYCDRNQYIFHYGDYGDTFYIILEGVVEIQVPLDKISAKKAANQLNKAKNQYKQIIIKNNPLQCKKLSQSAEDQFYLLSPCLNVNVSNQRYANDLTISQKKQIEKLQCVLDLNQNKQSLTIQNLIQRERRYKEQMLSGLNQLIQNKTQIKKTTLYKNLPTILKQNSQILTNQNLEQEQMLKYKDQNDVGKRRQALFIQQSNNFEENFDQIGSVSKQTTKQAPDLKENIKKLNLAFIETNQEENFILEDLKPKKQKQKKQKSSNHLVENLQSQEEEKDQSQLQKETEQETPQQKLANILFLMQNEQRKIIQFKTIATLKQNQSFGQNAILNNEKRNDSAFCKENCFFAVLDAQTYQSILLNYDKQKAKKIMHFIQQIQLFKE